MQCDEDEMVRGANSFQSIGFADEPNMELPASVADGHEYFEEAVDNDDEQPYCDSNWVQRIQINQKDRAVDPAEFRDSLAIRAGLIVVVVIALLGLAWIVRSLLSPNHPPSSPPVQSANSSAIISDSKGDRIPPLANAVRETFGELSAETSPQRLSSSTTNRTKPSLGTTAPAGSSIIGNSSDLQRHTSATRPKGKEADSRTKLTPVPETRPTTINGWTVREVTNGLAAVEGPNGTWRVRRGDAVPGLGRIDSIVLWGQRWIVATSQGLISTP
jgi:hypothetical protein